jgi:hypothetical protein
MTSVTDKKIIARLNWGVALLIPVLLAFGVFDVIVLNPPILHIKAPAYIPVLGCAVKRYGLLEEISPACSNSANLIPHSTAMSYNWMVGRAGRDYYRVGDDAYQIRCDNRSSSCVIVMTTYDAFSR